MLTAGHCAEDGTATVIGLEPPTSSPAGGSLPLPGSLAPLGSFRGALTARTDGVTLHAAATPSFPGGALFAVHDDKAVTAFDLRDVARLLRLQQGCTE